MRTLYTALCVAVIALTCVGAAEGKGISGCFVQLDQGGNADWSQDRWNRELEWMKALGMDTLILAQTARNQPKTQPAKAAYYPTTVEGFQPVGDDPVRKILTAARERKMKVYLGSVNDKRWFDFNPSRWGPEDQALMLRQMRETDEAIVRDLWRLYGTYDSLSGFYLTEEIDNVNWTSGEMRDGLVGGLLKPLGTTIKGLRPAKPLSVCEAPFFSLDQPPHDWQTWWAKTLADVPELDVLIAQDGVGSSRHIPVDKVAGYFEALRAATSAAKRELWADLEVFEYVCEKLSVTAPPDRVASQLALEQPLAGKVVCWEFSHFLSPAHSVQSLLLFENYQRSLDGRRQLANVALGKHYESSPLPSPGHPDAEPGKLTDGEAVFRFEPVDLMVGWQDREAVTITLDLGKETAGLSEICVFSATDKSAFISAPSSISVAVSRDRTTFEDVGQMDALTDQAKSLNLHLLRLNGPVSGRYVKLGLKGGGGWLILGEVGVLSERAD